MTKKPPRTPEELAAEVMQLYAQITHHQGQAVAHMRSALFLARDAGVALRRIKIQLKNNFGHGAWEPWVKANFPFTIETARGYLRIANQWKQYIEPKLNDGATLSIDQALNILRKPKAPEPLWNPELVAAVQKARTRLIASFRGALESWENEEVMFAAHLESDFLQRVFSNHLMALQDELLPLAAVFTCAVDRRRQSLRELASPEAEDKRRAIDEAYCSEIIAAFENVTDLSDLQKRIIFAEVRHSAVAKEHPERLANILPPDAAGWPNLENVEHVVYPNGVYPWLTPAAVA